MNKTSTSGNNLDTEACKSLILIGHSFIPQSVGHRIGHSGHRRSQLVDSYWTQAVSKLDTDLKSPLGHKPPSLEGAVARPLCPERGAH